MINIENLHVANPEDQPVTIENCIDTSLKPLGVEVSLKDSCCNLGTTFDPAVTYDLGANSLKWTNYYSTDLRIGSNKSHDALFCDTDKCKVRIQGVEFDEVLDRLAKLENRGFWNAVLRLFKRS